MDVWSDIVCPWCAIGRARLRKAADEAGVKLRIVHRAFELRPDTGPGRPTLEVLAERYGGMARAKEMTERVRGLAALDGLDLRAGETLSANTFDAHRLVSWAQARGDADALVERITAAHFTDLADVADRDVLRKAAESVGIDGEEAAHALKLQAHAREVRADEEMARELGITGVPFFVLDGRIAVSGAQPVDAFQDAIVRAVLADPNGPVG